MHMTKSAAIESFAICMFISALAVPSGVRGSALAGMTVTLVATGYLVVVARDGLQRVSEVDLKLWTGVLLSSIGPWWVYEGLVNWTWVTPRPNQQPGAHKPYGRRRQSLENRLWSDCCGEFGQ